MAFFYEQAAAHYFDKKDYLKALEYFKKSIENFEKLLPDKKNIFLKIHRSLYHMSALYCDKLSNNLPDDVAFSVRLEYVDKAIQMTRKFLTLLEGKDDVLYIEECRKLATFLHHRIYTIRQYSNNPAMLNSAVKENGDEALDYMQSYISCLQGTPIEPLPKSGNYFETMEALFKKVRALANVIPVSGASELDIAKNQGTRGFNPRGL